MYKVIDTVEQDFQKKYNRNLYCNEVESMGETKIVSAFGGHAQACGFTMHKDDVNTFKEMVYQQMDLIDESSFEYHYDIIDKMSFSQINLDFIKKLDQFCPYGQGYMFLFFILNLP